MNLSLDDPVKSEVGNTFKRHIKQDGKRISISTPILCCENGLKFSVNKTITAVLVPLDSLTVAELQRIENFVKSKLGSCERYKSLHLNKSMYVNVSKWCEYELHNRDGSTKPLPPNVFLGAGYYKLELIVSHIYYGPHRGGETASLSLHVCKLTYEPLEPPEIDNDFEDFLESLDCDVPASTSTQKKKKRPRKRKNAQDYLSTPSKVKAPNK